MKTETGGLVKKTLVLVLLEQLVKKVMLVKTVLLHTLAITETGGLVMKIQVLLLLVLQQKVKMVKMEKLTNLLSF